MATEIKNAFDGLINKWDTAEERTCNLKDAPKKLPKLKSKENKKKQERIPNYKTENLQQL